MQSLLDPFLIKIGLKNIGFVEEGVKLNIDISYLIFNWILPVIIFLGIVFILKKKYNDKKTHKTYSFDSKSHLNQEEDVIYME